jgi:hypothetical protein
MHTPCCAEKPWTCLAPNGQSVQVCRYFDIATLSLSGTKAKRRPTRSKSSHRSLGPTAPMGSSWAFQTVSLEPEPSPMSSGPDLLHPCRPEPMLPNSHKKSDRDKLFTTTTSLTIPSSPRPPQTFPTPPKHPYLQTRVFPSPPVVLSKSMASCR